MPVPRPLAELPPFAQATVDIVRDSASRLPHDPMVLTEMFYEELFAMEPEYRGLFPEDMRVQHERLLSGILGAINAMDKPERVEVTLRRWGALHRQTYGITDEMYVYVGHALVRCIRRLLAEEGTSIPSCWIALYEWMAAVMIDGANAADLEASELYKYSCRPAPQAS